MSNSTTKESNLIQTASLQGYFFDQLNSYNEKSTRPLPKEAIFYSSLVMDKMGASCEYFEMSEGKVREKILGTKLLEASKLTPEKKKRVYQDIGDTALLLCGYFSQSLNQKIVDESYYQELGVQAYNSLNNIVPEVYDVNSFFRKFSLSFTRITQLMSVVSQKLMANDPHENLLIIVDRNKIKAS